MIREVHSFAVYPAGADFVHPAPGEGAFDPFVLDVPVLRPEDDRTEVALGKAARRAWWSAFSYLQQQGPVEPEEFAVYELAASGANGRLVGSGGFVQ